MQSMTVCKLSSLNYQIKKSLFHVVTGMDTLEEKQLDTKVSIEVMGTVNIIQTEIEYLTLMLHMTLSLGILSLIKEIVTLSLISLVMRKTQINFILLRKCNLEMAKSIKVIPSKECVPQHKLLTCEL